MNYVAIDNLKPFTSPYHDIVYLAAFSSTFVADQLFIRFLKTGVPCAVSNNLAPSKFVSP